MSDAIVLARNGEQMELASKRNRIEYEQANAALETPTIYQDAMASSQSKMWCDAIKTELKVLNEKKPWTVVKKSPNKKVIGTKWVFAIKRNEYGEIKRFKALLVALGY